LQDFWGIGAGLTLLPREQLSISFQVRGRGGTWTCSLDCRLLSVGRGFLVLAVGHREEVLQLPLERLKGWSLHWILMPAF